MKDQPNKSDLETFSHPKTRAKTEPKTRNQHITDTSTSPQSSFLTSMDTDRLICPFQVDTWHQQFIRVQISPQQDLTKLNPQSTSFSTILIDPYGSQPCTQPHSQSAKMSHDGAIVLINLTGNDEIIMKPYEVRHDLSRHHSPR